MSGNIPDLECLAARAAANALCCDPSLMYDDDIQLGRNQIYLAQFREEPQSFISPNGNGLGLELVTLTFGVELDIEGEAGDGEVKWAAPQADLQWTQGGTAVFTATVDVARGMMLTLLARGVTVALRSPAPFTFLDDLDPPPIPEPFDKITINGAIAWGTRASRGVVTNTRSPFNVDPAGSSSVFPIPNFAYALDIYNPLNVATYTVSFFSGLTGGQLIHLESGNSYATGRAGEGVKIPPQANSYQINNTGAADNAFSPSFRLAL